MGAYWGSNLSRGFYILAPLRKSFLKIEEALKGKFNHNSIQNLLHFPLTELRRSSLNEKHEDLIDDVYVSVEMNRNLNKSNTPYEFLKFRMNLMKIPQSLHSLHAFHFSFKETFNFDVSHFMICKRKLNYAKLFNSLRQFFRHDLFLTLFSLSNLSS